MPKPSTNKIRKFLSLQTVSILIVIIGIAGRIIQLLFFFNIRVDGSYQYMAMQNFVHGHGITTGKVLPSDLSSIVYEPLINWPPGYSVLLAPFYLVTGHDYIVAGLTLDILCATILILVSRSILKILDVPLYLRNLYTLLTSFFVYSFYFIASSDSVAIAIFVCAIYLTLSILKNSNRRNWKIFLLSLCLLLCGWIKYLFIPAVFMIPLFLLTKGIADKNRWFRMAGIYLTATLFIGIGGLLVYQKMVSGSAAYIAQPERGFFPEHILDSYPFIPASFIKPDTVELTTLNAKFILRSYQIIHLLLLTAVLFYFIKTLQKNRLNITVQTSFFYISVFISASITLLLTYLSARVAKEEILPGWLWTYVEEPRYYGLILVLIHLSLFVFFRTGNTALRYLFSFLILLMVIESGRGVFFDARRLALWNSEEFSWQYENRFQKYADSIIRKEQKKYPVAKIVVTGSVYFMNHRVSLYSHIPVLYPAHKLNDPTALQTKEKVLLLIILRKENFSDFQPFLASASDKLVGQFDDFYFYTLYVEPD